jgi:dTDP-4-amino-4,6-dideoxy-D-galactose acyltransferase
MAVVSNTFYNIKVAPPLINITALYCKQSSHQNRKSIYHNKREREEREKLKASILVDIRAVEEEDIPQIKEIANTAFRLHRFWTDRDLEGRRVGEYYIAEVDSFNAELLHGRDGFEVFVADDGGEILGYIVLRIDKRLSDAFKCTWGVIASFALRSGSRGQGLGTILLSRALQWFREKGADRVDVSTDAENIAAIQCYEKQGFRTIYSGVTLTMKIE